MSVSFPSIVAAVAYLRVDENRNTAWVASKVWELKLIGKISILENVKEQEMTPLTNVVFGIGQSLRGIGHTIIK